MAGKHSFRDPVTGQLKGWGFADSNSPGDIAQVETEDFNLDPRDGWRWDGTAWVSSPLSKPVSEITLLRRAVLGNPQAKAQLQAIEDAQTNAIILQP